TNKILQLIFFYKPKIIAIALVVNFATNKILQLFFL
ncbi:hypothetical protein IGK_05616, partial [Bacillus toyonensis]